MTNYLSIFITALRLGLTSFGGPTAHLAYFHQTYVRDKKWLDDKNYADLVALSQFLPGPASSQVGIGIGLIRGGIVGAVISFIGFTLPSVIILISLAIFTQDLSGQVGFIHGLKLVAVAIIIQAIFQMAKNLTPDLKRQIIAFLALSTILLWQNMFATLIVIVVAGIIGGLIIRSDQSETPDHSTSYLSKKVGVICLTLYFSLLFILPFFNKLSNSIWIDFIDRFYRAGALVFGGGHVVLPLLETEFVTSGLVNEDVFLAGYGLTQAVPGPLFTFAAYLGTVIHGPLGGVIAIVAIFLPAFLLIVGALPFWTLLKRNRQMRNVINGMNAAVVGILMATLYHPIWKTTVLKPIDFVIVVGLYFLLNSVKVPPWLIVLLGATLGFVFL